MRLRRGAGLTTSFRCPLQEDPPPMLPVLPSSCAQAPSLGRLCSATGSEKGKGSESFVSGTVERLSKIRDDIVRILDADKRSNDRLTNPDAITDLCGMSECIVVAGWLASDSVPPRLTASLKIQRALSAPRECLLYGNLSLVDLAARARKVPNKVFCAETERGPIPGV